jgi:5-methylcytosine-specific restriction endonuclease McrA
VKGRRARCKECMRGKNARDRAARAGRLKGSEVVTAEQIRLMGERQGWRCACGCGRVIRWAYHLDHRVPLARGGRHRFNNLQLLAAICNLRKGAR